MADQRTDWVEATRDMVLPRNSKPKKILWEELKISTPCTEEVVVQPRPENRQAH